MEGSLLGWAQSRVLRTAIPALDGRAWIVRTALAAMVAWAVGMVPSTWWDELTRLPGVLTAVLATGGGLVLLASIGVAQWTVLRRHVSRSTRWIWWTAGAWLAGLGIFVLVATPLWQPGQGPVTVAAIGLLGGALMALTVAAITGWGLLRLLAGAGRPGGRRPGRAVPA
jgi:hypothetical protein